MTISSRRQFLRQASLGAAALYVRDTRVLAAATQVFESRAQDVAGTDAASIRKFASRIAGHVITPEMPDYESSRLVFNRAFNRRPALIVRCAGPSDVARALDFARTKNLALAVRGGGHNRAGLSVCDGGVVIDLSRMNRVEVDADKRVARAQAGALVRDLDQATQRFGLATTSGGCPTIGIAGLTLGGGEGQLMSKYGAACDNLIRAQFVTVDGRQVEASQNSNPDLFWAIRGGGGNFGVATALEYRLHPVTDVLAGTLTFPGGRIPELLQAFAKLVKAAPDEMSVVGSVLPSEQGTRFQLLFLHCGDPRQGNELLRPLRALQPQEDNVKVESYLQAQEAAFLRAPVAHFQTDLFLPELAAGAITRITTATNDSPPNNKVFLVPLYGAISRVAVSDTAFALRHPGYEVDIVSTWSVPPRKRVRCNGSSLCVTICSRLRVACTSTSWAKRAKSLCGRRTAQTMLGWWRSRKSTTPTMCCGSTRTSSQLRSRRDQVRTRPRPPSQASSRDCSSATEPRPVHIGPSIKRACVQ